MSTGISIIMDEPRRQALLLALLQQRALLVAGMNHLLAQQRALQGGRVKRRYRRTKDRTVWVSPWLQRRPLQGDYDQLLVELNRETPGKYKKYLRIDNDTFQELLQRVAPALTKKTTSARKPLEPGLKLAVTLRYLATGQTYEELSTAFRVSPNAISVFIPEVCDALIGMCV